MVEKIMISTIKFPAARASAYPTLFNPDGCYPYNSFYHTFQRPEKAALTAYRLTTTYALHNFSFFQNRPPLPQEGHLCLCGHTVKKKLW